ncbi:MAG TPA: 50S ribosomal protein L23 [Dehalococcoidia bacterium]|jgi:large subunit ribosomal protein L23|nr:50S ribosomal protein L23 [Dehalococcoidia bacterium]
MPKALHPYTVIVRPLVTEKSTLLSSFNKYAFEVMPHANKVQIKQAVEVAFNVRVSAVNTCNVRGKVRRFGRRQSVGRSWKKAIVTLKEGYKIELFEGV